MHLLSATWLHTRLAGQPMGHSHQHYWPTWSQFTAAMVLQIALLNAEHNSQLMLLAARNLTLLADVLPTICSSIVRHGAVPALCARLMTIEYIDLAEQSLQVSVHAATLCLSRTYTRFSWATQSEQFEQLKQTCISF